jgi:hypothetical protein
MTTFTVLIILLAWRGEELTVEMPIEGSIEACGALAERKTAMLLASDWKGAEVRQTKCRTRSTWNR